MTTITNRRNDLKTFPHIAIKETNDNNERNNIIIIEQI